jgi:hypothetical protein
MTKEDIEFCSKLWWLGFAGLIAFTYKHLGEEYLRKVLLDKPEKPNILGRERFEEVAEELELVGLTDLAKIISDHAKTLHSRFDEFHCVYLHPPHVGRPGNEANILSWRMRNKAAKEVYLARKGKPQGADIAPRNIQDNSTDGPRIGDRKRTRDPGNPNPALASDLF